MPWHRLGTAKVTLCCDYDDDTALVTVEQECEKCGASFIQNQEVGKCSDLHCFWLLPGHDFQDEPPPCVRKGNHMIAPEKAAKIRELADAGASSRQISKEIGVERGTVRAYLGPRNQIEGLRNWHARRKAEGKTPILPPWQRKRAAAPSVTAQAETVSLPNGAISRVAQETPVIPSAPKRKKVCRTCADLPHRRPQSGCPRCREPFAPERVEYSIGQPSNAGALQDL